MDQEKGFFAGLFDFSFSEFITTKIIKVLYVLAVIASVVGALSVLGGGVAALSYSSVKGLLMIILSPVAFILYVIVARIYLELVMVIFRIADDTQEIAQRGRATPPASGE